MDMYNNKPNSKKKFTLSLKKLQCQDSKEDSSSGVTSRRNNIPANNNSRSNTSESSDSQNFLLRVSDSFVIDDSDEEEGIQKHNEKKNDMEVIVISDSDEEDDSLRLFTQKSRRKFGAEFSKTTSSYEGKHEHLIQKCTTFCLNSSEEDDNRFPRRGGKIQSSEKRPSSIQYTSDESGLGLKIPMSEYLSPTHQNVPPATLTPVVTKNTNYLNHKSNSSERAIHNKFGTPNSVKLSERITPLTKRDIKSIKKTIDSRRLVYDPTNQWNRKKEISESESDSGEDIYTFKGTRKNIHPALIDKTTSEQDSIDDRQIHTASPTKTHVSKFLNPEIQDDPQATLSSRKKQQIAKWLMTSDDKSDESTSIVSPSTKNSPNSGNSSLERLEMNYETPNNRDKFRRILDSANKGSSGSSSTIKSRMTQSTIDNYLKKKKSITMETKTYSPIPMIEPQIISTNTSTGRTKKTGANNRADNTDKLYGKQSNNPLDTRSDGIRKIDPMDCADILDKLYGNAWRDTNVQYPITEPRKPKVTVENKGVQTERKNRSKVRNQKVYSTASSSDGDSSDIMLKKTSRKPREDSFINDSSSGGSGGETTYLTALTTPRISDFDDLKKNTPISALTRRAIEICDSDSDERTKNAHNISEDRTLDNRKRLVFSDGENSSSGTSEYDPDDIVPKKILPKSLPKIVKPKPSSKLPISVKDRSLRTKSFLASLSASVPLADVHPDAKRYRVNFKNTKDELCKYLYKLYNEKIFDNTLPHDMLIEWNVRMRGTAGFCYNRKSTKAQGIVERSSRLVLATKILDTPDRLRDTLVHELCHAAAWLVNNVSDGHGPFWKSWASKAMRAFPELPQIKRCHDYEIKTKFTYRCTSCGYSIGRHSKSLDTERKRCGHCHGKFELLINKVTKSGIQLETPKKKEPSGFALYVKENYKTLKKERQGLAHKEVMQLLGQQFSAFKISKKNKEDDGNSA